jgi:acyl-CoA reductase-like NAD-dependent aldehyde dehydrogenase
VANEAFPDWRRTPPLARARCLFRLKELVEERFEELKLEPLQDFSIEDEDRFDIPTFLRKQAD